MLDPVAVLICEWLRQVGLTVRETRLANTFLPGVALEAGGLAVDPARLLYPGDLLHEAGHLAVMTPEKRAAAGPDSDIDMGDEIAAQAWSYAAAVHLGLPPEVVFHAAGYRGSATKLVEIFGEGKAGVPVLQWMGLTFDKKQASAAGEEPYPHMIRWLREQSA